MPASSHRRNRTRRETDNGDNSDADMPDSSPSRPAKKKRKANTVDTTPSPNDPDEVELGLGSEQIVNAAISNLAMPKYEVVVSIQYHNDKNAREHAEGIQAYAKLAGRNWTYYVKNLKVNIGRPPDPVRHDIAHSSPQPSILPGEIVDIDLGPNKLVSRQHATIEYDTTEGGGSWQIRVNGRNGVRLDELLLKRGSRAELASGNVLEIGGTQMMFVLPGQEPQIHQMFLQWAQLMPHEHEDRMPSNEQTYLESFPNTKSSSQQLPVASLVSSLAPVPLAPAPPDYKRLSTPSSPRDTGSKRAKQSPAYNRGLLLETTENIDWSLDSSKDLKPPFSYATMIGQAILASDEEKLTLNMIYQWIQEKYAFYRHSTAGWQNSIRHNLSLNKAFQKIPRRTDEPGKGMKWQIVPEFKEDFTKRIKRPSTKGGNRGSSQPNSPAAKEQTMTLSSGIGQAISTMNVDEPLDIAESGTQIKYSPRSTTPPPLSSYPVSAKVAYTPDRGSRLPRGGAAEMIAEDAPDSPQDDSPLPAARSKANPMVGAYGLSDAAQGSPPTLSSSAYLEDHGSMITPAPRKHAPRLAPPSTQQLPSKFIPTSSPAPFWKYLDYGQHTPARPMPDLSPFKSGGPSAPQSSSPPTLTGRRESGSPSKLGGSRIFDTDRKDPKTIDPEDAGDDEDNGLGDLPGIDLARGFEKIGTFHASLTNASV